jgi:hypothetical protein
MGELMEEHVALKKKTWGELKGAWVPHDTRDRVVDFVAEWSQKTGDPASRFVGGWDWPKASSTTGRGATARPTSTTASSRDFWLEGVGEGGDRAVLPGASDEGSAV